MPRSGCSRISPASGPSTRPTGSSTAFTSLTRSIRRASRSATKITMTSLASSDGWTPMPPMPIQRRLPLITGAKNSTNSKREREPRDRGPDDERLLIVAIVDPHRHAHQQKADEHPRHLLEQETGHVPVLLQRHRGGGAAHHHRADAHEEQHGEEQDLVGFQLARHTVSLPPRRASTVRGTFRDLPGLRSSAHDLRTTTLEP